MKKVEIVGGPEDGKIMEVHDNAEYLAYAWHDSAKNEDFVIGLPLYRVTNPETKEVYYKAYRFSKLADPEEPDYYRGM